MCYVGKATKIFIFIVTFLVIIGLVLGFGLLRQNHQKPHQCSADYCHSSSFSSTSTPPTTLYPDPIPYSGLTPPQFGSDPPPSLPSPPSPPSPPTPDITTPITDPNPPPSPPPQFSSPPPPPDSGPSLAAPPLNQPTPVVDTPGPVHAKKLVKD